MYMDNLMVTAGTYEDFAGESEDDIPNSGNQNNNNKKPESTTTATTESAPATDSTDDANTASGGCGSVASLGGVALLMTLGAACMATDRKKRFHK